MIPVSRYEDMRLWDVDRSMHDRQEEPVSEPTAAPNPGAGPINVDVDELREAIRAEYTEVAEHPDAGFHFHTGRTLAAIVGYESDWMEGISEHAIESFAGTGNPFAMGLPQQGERIVDIGSGAGIDSLIAGRLVGPKGRVIGVDMTDRMLARARHAAAESGLDDRVEFRHGYMEELPVENGWAHRVISNGVLNLTPDKPRALAEMHRVLRPGGFLQIGDIAVDKPVSEAAKQRIDLWTG
jgi:arsenite methyltransferase